MNQLLHSFRGQVFEASMQLFKKVLLRHLLTSILISLVTFAIAIPLILQGLGWTFNDLSNFQTNFQAAIQNLDKGSNPYDAIFSLFGDVNVPLIVLAITISLILNIWSYVAFLKINENEVFGKSYSLVDIYRQVSLNLVFRTIGIYFLLNFFIVASFGLFFAIIFIIGSVSVALAAIVGFIGFFLLLIQMVRFSLVLPAIIHDNLSMSEAFGFSFQKITFKRAGLIFLIGIVFIIATSMVTGIFSLIINLALGNNENLLMVSFIINQGFSLIIGGLSGAFIFAALSALYYRYTEHGKDDNEEENFDAHVIDSN
jgi:hypothetical protein